MANTAYNAIQVDWEYVRQLAFSDISGGGWVAFGIPFAVQPRIVKCWNKTDADIWLSKAGVDGTEIDYVPAQSGFIYDLTANKTAETFNIPNGTQLYVKVDGAAPTLGKVVFVSIFGNTQY